MQYLAVSIPVHEALDCVLDQAGNWAYFAPDAILVFHVSQAADFTPQQLSDLLPDVNANAHVNPKQLTTGWANGTLLPAHMSNLTYVKQNFNAHFFAMDASNTMLVRHGLIEHMSKNGIGSGIAGYNPVKPSISCASAYALHQDEKLLDTVYEYGCETPGIVPCEGMWMDTDTFTMVSDFIAKKQWHGNYATEEVYPVTALNMINPSHRRVAGNYIMTPFEANLYVTRDDVIAIHYGDHKNQDLFGVKRIPREFNHPLRNLLRAMSQY